MKLLSLLCITASLALLAAMNTITIPHLVQITGEIAILDLRFTGYNLQSAKELFDRLGPAGREYYVFPQLALDFLYPILFIVGYSTAIYRMRESKDWLMWIGIGSCVVGGFFDLLENFCTWSGLVSFPTLNPKLIQIGSVATILKFAFSSVGLLIFFILLANRLRLKNKS